MEFTLARTALPPMASKFLLMISSAVWARREKKADVPRRNKPEAVRVFMYLLLYEIFNIWQT
jgi:hypothetical protein